ncbi:MAG: hypothetical protein LBS85_01860, partial [Clostridiales Family XIII bacterium]|nr:hypothetical protein [Clostridiales Family XIII bacterium]
MKTNKKKLGVYVHIPFCVRKCPYCDFRSFEIADADIHRSYMEKVVCEAAWKKEMFSPGYLVDSIYIGGGT